MVERDGAALVPYYLKDSQCYFFLQKRTADAPTNPGRIGFFGGGIEEGETANETVLREVKEELGLDLEAEAVKFFSQYHFQGLGKCNVFIFEVKESFATEVSVHEGEWGRFLSESEIRQNEQVLVHTRNMLADLAAYLHHSER